MSLQCIFNRFSVYVDVVSNENVALFWIQSLSVCKGITFLITELRMFSLAQRPVGSVSIIEPEAPGVLLRFFSPSRARSLSHSLCGGAHRDTVILRTHLVCPFLRPARRLCRNASFSLSRLQIIFRIS